MKNFKKLTFILSITGFFFIGCGEKGPVSSTYPSEKTMNKALKTTNMKILEVINNVRAEEIDCFDGNGIVGPSDPLVWNDKLYRAAYEHSNDLSSSNTFDHIGSGTISDITGSNIGNKSGFKERIRGNGYTGYQMIGENIAGGYGSIEESVNAWLESPTHCTNIMKAEFTEIGVAVVAESDTKYGLYWTQNFGDKIK